MDMSVDGSITNQGMLLSENGVMYVVSFYPSPKSQESPETLIKRALQKEVLSNVIC